ERFDQRPPASSRPLVGKAAASEPFSRPPDSRSARAQPEPAGSGWLSFILCGFWPFSIDRWGCLFYLSRRPADSARPLPLFWDLVLDRFVHRCWLLFLAAFVWFGSGCALLNTSQ